ncbi:phosphorylase B kinase gamma catalytic chain, skeletal muscle isoform [Trichinella spiralis]|uniref:phosphorylase B kinase gamma catalytic chain, skeletal muscle isoform n=1 Tax=Trichinella spiralis TaxID=6334 RepID=UPI0001EFC031|nr:phosphorylase B kinase gamma catalytic chain, skeletal muscle isoform [Trichinella spiralis]
MHCKTQENAPGVSISSDALLVSSLYNIKRRCFASAYVHFVYIHCEKPDMPPSVADVEDSHISDPKCEFYTNYDCKEILGKGMSSTVRRCIRKSTGKEYAVKIIDVSSEKATEEQARELRETTLREIRILKMMAGHQNITKQYFRHIMKQLLEAVKAMHQKNIVHRDIKLENVLMVDDETVKLTDFGFAYEITGDVQLTELCGTPGYLAPEVLKVSMYDSVKGYGLEVDLWACGVIMYTLLCGYAPFYHRKQIYMLRAITEGRYEFRSPEWDEISEAAKDLIRKLLSVDPKARATAKEALAHPYFQQNLTEESATKFLERSFDAKKKFRLAIVQVRLLVRLLRIRYIPILVAASSVQANPYATRKIRKHIDALAFRIYGHWVKKGREQFRDALFANAVKNDMQRFRKPVMKGDSTPDSSAITVY